MQKNLLFFKLIVVMALLISWPAAYFRFINLGVLTLPGLLSGVLVLFALLACLMVRWTNIGLLKYYTPLGLFVFYAIIRTISESENMSLGSVQNLSIWIGFLTISIVTTVVVRNKPDFIHVVLKNLYIGMIFVGLVLVVSYLIHRKDAPASIVAIFPFAYLVSMTSNTAVSNVFKYLMALLLLFLVYVAGTRTSAVAMTLFPFIKLLLFVNVRSFVAFIVQSAFILGIIFAVVYFAFQNFDSFRNSFLEGDGAIDIGGFVINTSGRDHWWGIVWASYLTSPWIGLGVPVAESMDAEIGWSHPHNDYLRILHQFGALGLTLWVSYFLIIFSVLNKHMRSLHSSLGYTKQNVFFTTTLLSIFGVSATMITDNPIVYGYVMYPLAVLIGGSLGLLNCNYENIRMCK